MDREGGEEGKVVGRPSCGPCTIQVGLHVLSVVDLAGYEAQWSMCYL